MPGLLFSITVAPARPALLGEAAVIRRRVDHDHFEAAFDLLRDDRLHARTDVLLFVQRRNDD
jgi:hypothetical protein